MRKLNHYQNILKKIAVQWLKYDAKQRSLLADGVYAKPKSEENYGGCKNNQALKGLYKAGAAPTTLYDNFWTEVMDIGSPSVASTLKAQTYAGFMMLDLDISLNGIGIR